jgi:hypothetical protein
VIRSPERTNLIVQFRQPPLGGFFIAGYSNDRTAPISTLKRKPIQIGGWENESPIRLI